MSAEFTDQLEIEGGSSYWDTLRTIARNNPPLDDVDARKYVEDFKTTGNTEALHAILYSNMRAVYKLAGRESERLDIPFKDLANAGILEALKAIPKFDLNDGRAKVSTYLWTAIRRGITRQIRKETGTPFEAGENIDRIKATANRLTAEKLGKRPSLEELERETGIEKEEIIKLAKVDKVRHTSSMNELDDEDKALVDRDFEFGIEDIDSTRLWQVVANVSETLTEKQRMVLDKCIIGGMPGEWLANELGLSPQAISLRIINVKDKLRRAIEAEFFS